MLYVFHQETKPTYAQKSHTNIKKWLGNEELAKNSGVSLGKYFPSLAHPRLLYGSAVSTEAFQQK